MFYKTGVDITNDKQMFNFLKNHFEYYTMNSWNIHQSIANNVKLNRLGLSGDWCVAYNLLCNGEYETINDMIANWRRRYPRYEVYFNGRSSGYLVLYETGSNSHVLPECIVECDDYDEYKSYCKDYYGSVRANRDELVYCTKLVQDFDKLCDEIRDYCDELSNFNFEVIEMEKSVDLFNSCYEDDLYFLDFEPLTCDDKGRVDVSEIVVIKSLFEAFKRIADRQENGYILKCDKNNVASYEEV